MSLAPYVRILGRGPGRSRSLTQDEAFQAMTIILDGKAAPEATGALLMLLRMKGETAEELAGVTAAARTVIAWNDPAPALDWPSYAAGRSRGLPWFLLSAKLVAEAGHTVLLHGTNTLGTPISDVRSGLPALHIPIVHTPAEAAKHAIAYAPIESISPALHGLLRLRDDLGLRSCINTVLRMLNPTGAAASVQGVFHPSYRTAQSDALHLLGQQNLTVIKGGGGEFERHPAKAIAGFGLRGGARWDNSYPALLDAHQRLADATTDPRALANLWTGAVRDDFAEKIVLGTAAAALDTLGRPDPFALAQSLWANRTTLTPA